MKKATSKYLHVFLGALFLLHIIGCEEPYNPELSLKDQNILVVEGHLTDGPCTIRLSQSSELDGEGRQPEPGASVWIENLLDGQVTDFKESDMGNYVASPELLSGSYYRLHIKTSEGQEFQSDSIEVLDTPPISLLEWEVVNGAVEIYLSTEADGTGSSRFYKWNFTETWKYLSEFRTSIQYKDGQIQPLPLEDQYHICYKTEASKTTIIGNSLELTENKISKKLIARIPPLASERLKQRYSIEVAQYSLPLDAFEFYSRLRANTEELGTLFDPQPSVLVSNIHSVEGERKVLGFVTAGKVVRKRIFIDRSELPFPFYGDEFAGCNKDTIPFPMDSRTYHEYFEDGRFLPIEMIGPNLFLGSAKICVDCREQGGVTEKPDFW